MESFLLITEFFKLFSDILKHATDLPPKKGGDSSWKAFSSMSWPPILVGIILQLFADWLDRQRHDK
jgi:hypothetical protein